MSKTIQEIAVPKKAFELYRWLEKGSDEWWDAYYEYPHRVMRWNLDSRRNSSWFNKALKQLKAVGICKEVPFVLVGSPFPWRNPGVKSNGQELKAEIIYLTDGERKIKTSRIL